MPRLAPDSEENTMADDPTTVETGLQRLLTAPPSWLQKTRLGLLCNSASVDPSLVHARVLIHRRFAGRLRALYAPQHGFFAEKQDNMKESDDIRDPLLDLPVFSLYGRTRSPTAEMLAPVDVLLVDLQDVGTRVYTFAYTLSYCMEAARTFNKHVVVLDRPNPLGGFDVEGNLLEPSCASFVGRYALPMRHGLTIGELARWMNRHCGIGCELKVIPMQGWHRAMRYQDTGLPWVAPSPNLPTPSAAAVYPGQVLWEGTNVSEGRGTTQPFELFGAPYWEPYRLLDALSPADTAGAVLRPCAFEPVANKWAGRLCRGFQLHVTNPHVFQPYRTSLRLLQAVISLYPNDFAWSAPPYEYEWHRRPIDLIIGSRTVRERIESLEDLTAIEADWTASLAAFRNERPKYLLYF